MQDLYQTDLDGGDGETGLHPVALTNWQDFYKRIYLERWANSKKIANKNRSYSYATIQFLPTVGAKNSFGFLCNFFRVSPKFQVAVQRIVRKKQLRCFNFAGCKGCHNEAKTYTLFFI